MHTAQVLTFWSAELALARNATLKTSGGITARLANVSNTGLETSPSLMTAVDTTWTTVVLFIEIEQDTLMPRASAEGLVKEL